MELKLATAEKEVLEELVKQVQSLDLRGETGNWKEFLNVYDKNVESPNDPLRRSHDELVQFLKTFKKKEDFQVLKCHANHLLVEKLKQESPDNDTPEQETLQPFLSTGIIFVLKIDHPKVIDTAFVFKYSNERKLRRPLLNNLCKVTKVDSSEDADQAFENVDAIQMMDSLGLPQKLVVFKTSSGSRTSLYVRKMMQPRIRFNYFVLY